MQRRLSRLSDALLQLAARVQAEGCSGFDTSVDEILLLRRVLAARPDLARNAELRRLDMALDSLARAFTHRPSPAPRRDRRRARHLAILGPRLLRQAALLLGLTTASGVLACLSMPAAAGTCSLDPNVKVCTGPFVTGLGFTDPVTSLTDSVLGADVTPLPGSAGISLTSVGFGGTHHGAASTGTPGGPGANLTLQSLDTDFRVITIGDNANGVTVQSTGGGAGNGGGGVICGIIPCESGGDGGPGGVGGNVILSNFTQVTTGGDNAAGVYALSHGGLGGSGGDSNGGTGAGTGGPGGNAGTVNLTNDGVIGTAGFQANGVYAASIGGNGGSGGGGFAWASGAAGGGANSGNAVVLVNNKDGVITTTGLNAIGIYGESVGGFGGGGGGSAGLFGYGGDGSLGGNAGSVNITNFASVTTIGNNSYAIFGQSVGGGGGNGGSGAGIVSLGGGGSAGGTGSTVTVENHGFLQTGGIAAHGIFAESIGGGGGNGGDAGGLTAMGGTGSSTSPSDLVTVSNLGGILTTGARAMGILAQSIGGGGGDGGSAGGIATIGGGGGDGGDGGEVIVNNSGNIETTGNDATALFAQSVGGGGGNGGSATSVGLFAAVAVGGDGANGGIGKDVLVNADNTAASAAFDIATLGDRSAGILAQSVGGGGGNGGYAFAGSIGPGFSASLAVGGGGGKGGDAGNVDARANGTILTEGISSDGIQAQSVGGGGGNGGFAIAVSGSDGAALTFTLGGKGNLAGSGETSTVMSWTDITTVGDMSVGGLAESIGGGGGSGGFAVSVAAGGEFGGALGWGGSAGAGGAGGVATLTSVGNVTTLGDYAHGLVAESIGGGGGNGGFAVAGAFTTGAAGIGVGLGGKSGAGGDADLATLTSTGNISTRGFGADGLIAQSIGGGGGTGGFAGALGASAGGGAVSLALGGDGSAGGAGSVATLTSTGNVTTTGDEAIAAMAQSVGGGGGNGGFAISFSASTQSSLSVALGGGGGQGGVAMNAVLVSTGAISTSGADAFGLLSQSIGGSGGNGGFAASGSLTTSGNPTASVSVGGDGGIGATAGEAHLTSTGDVTTLGAGAIGIFAQSVGGGGGNGGLSGALALGNGDAYAKTVGGAGGSGNTAALAKIISTGNVTTFGDNAAGILSQSVGGGGGNGGMTITVAASVKGNATGKSDAGVGGSGGTAAAVDLTSNGAVVTEGDLSDGLIAQSIGGGGGNGGFAIGAAFSAQGSGADINSVGGNGGSGNNSGIVTLISDATPASSLPGYSVFTMGKGSDGIFAQSVGGGGGNGGFAISGAFSVDGTAANNTVGGTGGAAGDAQQVFVTNTGSIATLGDDANAIQAQSIGGGGGNGGFAIGAAGSVKMDAKSTVGGGGAGTGGISRSVTVTNTGNIGTVGMDANGIFAQSVGGGGGNGGFAISAAFSNTGGATSSAVGGNGGGGGAADLVTVTQTGIITTQGMDSNGIFAQSVGGGGGNGGWSAGAAFSLKGDADSTVGGQGSGIGGAGNNAKGVTITDNGAVITFGSYANAIFAQSVGGGGGNGGFAVGAAFSSDSGAASNVVGGLGGSAGNADFVTVISNGDELLTQSDNADGILAQSVGGGGGNGGFAVGATLSLKGDSKSSVGGGGAGTGGTSGVVNVQNVSEIFTLGAGSDGIFAQSVGGGGGNGGFAVSGAFSNTGGATSNAVGGNGGAGGTANTVTVAQTGTIITEGLGSDGVLAQSVGGGGGNGGWNVGAGFSLKGDASSTVGGDGAATGGIGSDGKAVTVNANGTIVTSGASADAIFAQSVGGGGGNGGFAISGAFSNTGGATSNSVGGGGGAAGNADQVQVNAQGALQTSGDSAMGILAQSVGGGGGDGGFSIGAGLSVKGTSGSTVGGGAGGTAGNGGEVDVIESAGIATMGGNATGILAQSVGGGGGNGGFSVAGAFSADNSATTSATGGNGGAAGNGVAVNVTVNGFVFTSGLNANGVTAQSVGGGGGNGGFAAGAGFSSQGDTNSTVGGGTGGTAGTGGVVTLTSTQFIETTGMNSLGILAQSVGGGGGNGGFAASGAFSLDGGATNSGVGGAGAGGGNADMVTVTNSGIVETEAANATAILAQSVGGGGGNGGFSVGLGASKSDSVSSTVGGSGGSAGVGGDVTVNNLPGGSILTVGDLSYGIEAQSVGGGGGSGGFAVGGSLSLQGDASSTVGGGTGAGGGAAGLVTVNNFDNVETNGMSAIGILAQSVGGGGGSGGFAGGLAAGNSGAASNSVGGAGGMASTGGDVIVDNEGFIGVSGVNSIGILAQSIGGGGGNGGFSLSGSGAADGDSASSSVGGAGGGGGAAGNVQVTNGVSATVFTRADLSYGIEAQSIGGGGGNGGFSASGGFTSNGDAKSSVGGGSGSGGGNAGTVLVSNLGQIETDGAQSIGVFAQSVGGGGGSGGFAGSLSVGSSGGTSNSIGGAGANGGSAALVTVDNSGSILTEGANSIGVLAQSIGGGGGNGGFSLSASGSSGNGTSTSVGGSGAGGGAGGDVVVSNNGSIETQGALSYGVYAQSVGGGGGNGGFSVAGTLSDGGGMTSSVGGSGAGGGAGGNVTVTNTGSILVQSAGSVGVFAQSVGGGGGSGGFSGAVRFDSGGDLGGTVGASGGAGGAGGNVTVTSTGSIETDGDDSVGVLAQSVGGGGGNSSFAISAMTGRLSSARLDLGGDSTGAGGVMGTVIVNVSGGTVKTLGALSFGVLAQSVGGGGGNAALSVPDPLTVGPGGVTLTVGAGGSISGDGNVLNSSNSNPVATSGAGSLGLIAQSIGGGGGMEGDTGDLDIGDTVGAIADLVGGSSSNGGSGQLVTFANSGAVATSGDDALGILAQSIGGGGGDGFFAVGVVTGTAESISLQAGGSQGLAGNGAAVTLTSLTGNVSTSGRMADALVVQSIGGGGGVASFVAPSGIPVGTAGISLSDGASGGAGGNGAALTFISSGTLSTSGVGGAGLVAQSIGGGGGLVSFDSDGAQDPAITAARLGGAASGNGGAVGFTVAGAVSTSGANAPSVLAQSIGGGGGLIESAGAAFNTPVLLGGSANGNGGVVGVTQNAAIVTSGNNSSGLVAQSIGGGGGLLLAASQSGAAQSVGATAAAGSSGNGGTVSLAINAPITTSGAQSFGVIAQSFGGGGGMTSGGGFSGSEGGSGNGGAVSVTVNANILASGVGANAIFAQSAGGSGNGDIAIDIENGIVTASGDSAATIRFADGAANSLINRGTVTTALGVAGMVLQGGGGTQTVDNFGTLTGSADLGAAANMLNNHAGAVFNSGVTLNLGSGTLGNSGKLSVGGDFAIGTTALTGNFAQGNGTIFVDADMAQPGAAGSVDRLTVSGAATLSGTVLANIINPGSLETGTHEAVFLAASSPVQHAGVVLSAPTSAIVTYALDFQGDNALLSEDVNFAPAGLTPNEIAVGDYINAAQGSGGSAAFHPVIAALFALPDNAGLARAYDSFMPTAQLNAILSSSFASQYFTGELFSCAVHGGQISISNADSCVWGRVSGRALGQSASAGVIGLNEQAYSFAGGVERGVGNGWRVGGALNYEDVAAHGQPIYTSNGHRLQAGMVVKKEVGDLEFAGALTGGEGWFATQRQIALMGTLAQGHQDVGFVSLSLRANDHIVLDDNGYIKPGIELLGTQVNSSAFHETGAGPLDIDAGGHGQGYLRLRPHVEIGGDYSDDGLWIRPTLDVGVNSLLAGDRTVLDVGLDGAGTGLAPFRIATHTDVLTGDISAGLEITNAQGVSAKLGYFGQYGASTSQQGLSVKLVLPF